MTDLAGTVVDARAQLASEDETTADPGPAHDADHVSPAPGGADACLGECERVAVVHEGDRELEALGQRPRELDAGPLAVHVRKEHGTSLGVDETRDGHADGLDGPCAATELHHPAEHGRGTALGGARRRAPGLDDHLVVQERELDVGGAEVEAEASQRAVHPPSTTRTVPVTNSARAA
jgi:hypothetical protein